LQRIAENCAELCKIATVAVVASDGQFVVFFGDIFVRWPVFFVEQNPPFQFQAASAVAFAWRALLRIVQNCLHMQRSCCSDNSLVEFAARWVEESLGLGLAGGNVTRKTVI
jgi:hypothetical protein